MNIGDLNKRITLQYQTKVSDGLGAFTTTWVDACEVWAAIWPVSSAEIVQANSPTMLVTTKIRIRYRSVIKSSWRVKFGKRYFNIVSIVNANERNEYLDLMCKEAA